MTPPTITEAVDEAAGTLVRRAPSWAVGVTLWTAAVFIGLWFMRETIVLVTANQNKLEQLILEVKHCHEMRDMLDKEVKALKEENSEFRVKLAQLEKLIKPISK